MTHKSVASPDKKLRVVVMGAYELARYQGRGVTDVLSVCMLPHANVGAEWAKKNGARHEHVAMMDVTDTSVWLAPAEHQVRDIVAWGRDVRARGGKAIIHCAAGISRSTAAAITVLADAFGKGREADVVAKVFAARPVAFPNALLIRHADDVLKRRGYLEHAVRRRKMQVPTHDEMLCFALEE